MRIQKSTGNFVALSELVPSISDVDPAALLRNPWRRGGLAEGDVETAGTVHLRTDAPGNSRW